MASKLMSMAEAVGRFVPDGSSVALGLALEPLIPFAAGHELIRQGRRDLTLIGPISDILFDQLIGAGCVARVEAAWVGNVSAGLGHCYRRALEQGMPRRIEVRDHSNFTIAQALLAGAIGAPYIPMRSLLGSDIARDHPLSARRLRPSTARRRCFARSACATRARTTSATSRWPPARSTRPAWRSSPSARARRSST